MSGYTRQQSYRLTRRLYKLIRENADHIKFRRLRGAYGLYAANGDITIDHHRGCIIPTLIHEALHHWYPEWSETRVLQQEKKIMTSLTPQQVINIMKVLVDHFCTARCNKNVQA